MNDTMILTDALAFHGHKCWASTAGVRLGLAAMDALGATRSGAKQLHAIIETGDHIVLPGLTWLGLSAKVAAGTTALVVVFASFSGFLGHLALGALDPVFLLTMAVLATSGSLVGSHLMQTRLTSAQLKRFIGILLWVIAAKMALDLLG